MAMGHAKYTGRVGLVTSTQGPGAVHLVNGLYDAKLTAYLWRRGASRLLDVYTWQEKEEEK